MISDPPSSTCPGASKYLKRHFSHIWDRFWSQPTFHILFCLLSSASIRSFISPLFRYSYRPSRFSRGSKRRIHDFGKIKATLFTMLFQSFVLLGYAASTMADGFCVAFGPEAPPISLWKWVPEPVAAATASATTDGSVQPITTATVQPATTATLGTTSDAWAGWDEVSTTASQSPLVSSTSSAVSDVKPVLTSSTSGASAVSPEQTTTSVKHFVPSAAPTTLVSKFVPTTSTSAAASSASTTSGSKPSNSVDATSTGVEPTSAAPSEVFFGLGTRYGGDCKEEDCWQKGACSFVDYDLPSAVDGSTCVSEDIWNNGANCGGCISVSYKGKTITVMVCAEHQVTS